MIKTQVLVKRKVGMTREAFADYWLGTHVAITAKIGQLKRQTISIVRSDLQRADTPDCVKKLSCRSYLIDHHPHLLRRACLAPEKKRN